MAPPRHYWPAEPLQYVRARRGEARSVQHVVAKQPGWRSDPGNWVPTLCRQEVRADGTMPRWSDGERQLGPKTQPALVTAEPDPDFELCLKCAKTLAKIQSAPTLPS